MDVAFCCVVSNTYANPLIATRQADRQFTRFHNIQAAAAVSCSVALFQMVSFSYDATKSRLPMSRNREKATPNDVLLLLVGEIHDSSRRLLCYWFAVSRLRCQCIASLVYTTRVHLSRSRRRHPSLTLLRWNTYCNSSQRYGSG